MDKRARGVVITPDGEVEHREVGTDLADLQEVVGGNIECVALTEKAHLYCDEEGKLKEGARPNALATTLAEHYLPGFTMHDVVVGTVVVLGMGEDGEEVDVPAAVVDAITVIEQRAKAKLS